MTETQSVELRPLQLSDLPRIFDMQLEPESNRMAAVTPRTWEAFDSHWRKSLFEPGTSNRAILFGGLLVGYISIFQMEGKFHVGYWIDRPYWGKGIASRSLQLLLCETTWRPLVATVATNNLASLRILEKSGFVVEQIRHSPASERYQECEEACLVLK